MSEENQQLKSFANEKDAQEWMFNVEIEDENCIDNYRFAYVDDETAMFLYHEAQADGCCGGFDEKVLVNGKEAMIGCNYGH